MKHGPISLIVDGMPAVFIATAGPQYKKIMGNIEEVRARRGKIIAVATEGDETIKDKKSNPTCRHCCVFREICPDLWNLSL
jgi:glucosamine 6-phosphate synthetase-like amidotransferase/phosphosugar isomerase protein